jgi:LPXTG-site transpeptidase (sortase) family protein
LKRKLILILSILLFMGAVAITAYPMIANYVNDKYQSTIRTEYAQEVEAMDDGEIRETRQDAIAYNESLLPIRYDREALQTAAEDYDGLLNLHGSGLMGYVEIPKIDVNLPIYHGTSEEVLQKGIGHLLGSSLPTGGEGFHSVLTGHSGLAGAKLFSDLDQLAPGDTFFLHVLGETLAYEVAEINTVLPYETELLLAVPGEDLCTLVTCTPYGVNSHRLLVRGSRVPYENAVEETAKEAPKEPVRSTWKENYLQGLVIGSGSALGAVLLGVGFFLLKKWRKRHEA